MPNLITDIKDINNLIISERMKVYHASFNFKADVFLKYEFFENIVQKVSQRDKIKITLENENNDRFTVIDKIADKDINSEKDYKEFVKEALNDEMITVKVEIAKEMVEERFSIYCFEKFAEDLLALDIEEMISSFVELLKLIQDRIMFELFDQTQMFMTKTMFFLPHGSMSTNTGFERMKRLQRCRENSYFYNLDFHEVIPDDFKIEVDYEENPLRPIFDKITTLLSIIFMASSSSIEKSKLAIQISGHRTIQYDYLVSDISYNDNLYKVYSWIFTDGNVIDKAIIARNIISLHCQYVEIFKMDEKVLASIKSNFKLYLRDNVQQYIELKNKIAEFISEIISKTGEYAMDTLEKFKGNLIAIFGFLFTVVLANIVSDQPLDNIFTRDITILMQCVLVGSAIYLVISYFQSGYQVRKVYDSYEELKKNYDDILTQEDIKEIFKNDETIKKMKKTINKSRWIYVIIWGLFLVLLLVIIEVLSTHPIIFPLIKKIFKGISVFFRR